MFVIACSIPVLGYCTLAYPMGCKALYIIFSLTADFQSLTGRETFCHIKSMLGTTSESTKCSTVL